MLLKNVSFAPVVVVLAAALSGCGSDDSSSSGGNDKFVGTWSVTGGSVISTGDCDSTDPLEGPFVFTKGSTSDLVVTIDSCAVKFDVSGNSASAVAGQICTGSAQGVTVSRTIQSLVVTSADGKVATVSGTALDSATVAGAAFSCPVTITGNLQKL